MFIHFVSCNFHLILVLNEYKCLLTSLKLILKILLKVRWWFFLKKHKANQKFMESALCQFCLPCHSVFASLWQAWQTLMARGRQQTSQCHAKGKQFIWWYTRRFFSRNISEYVFGEEKKPSLEHTTHSLKPSGDIHSGNFTPAGHHWIDVPFILTQKTRDLFGRGGMEIDKIIEIEEYQYIYIFFFFSFSVLLTQSYYNVLRMY